MKRYLNETTVENIVKLSIVEALSHGVFFYFPIIRLASLLSVYFAVIDLENFCKNEHKRPSTRIGRIEDSILLSNGWKTTRDEGVD